MTLMYKDMKKHDIEEMLINGSLPEGVEYDGYLTMLGHSHPYTLPNKLTVTQSLDVSDSGLGSLPDDLVVHDNLYCSYGEYKGRSNNIFVGKDLWFSSSVIEELPEKLVVGGNISFIGATIGSFEGDIHVGGTIYVDDGVLSDRYLCYLRLKGISVTYVNP
jgi:hypothetical protein